VKNKRFHYEVSATCLHICVTFCEEISLKNLFIKTRVVLNDIQNFKDGTNY